MKKFLIVWLFFVTTLCAVETLQSDFSFKASGDVQAMVHSNGLLYAATSNSSVDIFDLNTTTMVRRIEVPFIKDFMGDMMPSKIYSVDVLNEKVVFVSEGKKGYRNLWLDENKKITKIIDVEQKWFMRKVMFVDDNTVLIGLLTNELILYDIKNAKVIYNKQMSASSFSDFMLSEDKKTYAATDESGIVRVVDTRSGKVKRVLKGQNLDKVFQLDYKKGIILTAGQDRRSVLYESDDSASYLEFHFLLYSCALSPDAKYAAVAYNEQNHILIYKTSTKSKRYNLVGQDATLTQILFLDTMHVIASSDSKTINFWTLK